MAYDKLSEFVYDCAVCPTRCDGISKCVYDFTSDAAFSEKYEQQVIDRINRSALYKAFKCREDGYPDVEIRNIQGDIHSYLEVKVQQRTFMSVQSILPKSNLAPSETVALNRSDLLRYFNIEEQTRVKTSILWFVLNRRCIVPQGRANTYYQTTQVLKGIYEAENNKRMFKRKLGEGDIVDGIHKGVTVNYHFSLKELLPWHNGFSD